MKVFFFGCTAGTVSAGCCRLHHSSFRLSVSGCHSLEAGSGSGFAKNDGPPSSGWRPKGTLDFPDGLSSLFQRCCPAAEALPPQIFPHPLLEGDPACSGLLLPFRRLSLEICADAFPRKDSAALAASAACSAEIVRFWDSSCSTMCTSGATASRTSDWSFAREASACFCSFWSSCFATGSSLGHFVVSTSGKAKGFLTYSRA